MATPRAAFSLSRTLFTNKQTLTSFLLSRSYSSVPSSCSLSLLRLRPLASIGFHRISMAPPSSGSLRTFSTRQQSMNDNNSPNWSNRPPKETILLDGCDFEHWLVVTEPPSEGATRDEIIDSYIKTLAQIVGSEEEARMKIYSVSTRHYFAFGALVSEELSLKLKELPHVRWVLPDSYLDVKNKDYGGEPFINGQAVPYDPKYHEEWVRNNQKAMERNRRNDRPRNNDRSRNFDRRQRNPGFQNNPGGGPSNMGPGGPSNMGPGGPSNMGPGGPPNMPPPNNPGYQPNNPGYQSNNPGFAQNMPPNNNPGFPPNNPGFTQNMPPNNPGFAHNQNHMSGPPLPNRGGGMPPPNYSGGQVNAGYPNNMPNNQPGGYHNPQMANHQNNYAPQSVNNGGQGVYQGQDVPGRDVPHYQ